MPKHRGGLEGPGQFRGGSLQGRQLAEIGSKGLSRYCIESFTVIALMIPNQGPERPEYRHSGAGEAAAFPSNRCLTEGGISPSLSSGSR